MALALPARDRPSLDDPLCLKEPLLLAAASRRDLLLKSPPPAKWWGALLRCGAGASLPDTYYQPDKPGSTPYFHVFFTHGCTTPLLRSPYCYIVTSLRLPPSFRLNPPMSVEKSVKHDHLDHLDHLCGHREKNRGRCDIEADPANNCVVAGSDYLITGVLRGPNRRGGCRVASRN